MRTKGQRKCLTKNMAAIDGFKCTDCIMDKIFKKNLNRKIHYDSVKEHPKVSKITKFDCEML